MVGSLGQFWGQAAASGLGALVGVFAGYTLERVTTEYRDRKERQDRHEKLARIYDVLADDVDGFYTAAVSIDSVFSEDAPGSYGHDPTLEVWEGRKHPVHRLEQENLLAVIRLTEFYQKAEQFIEAFPPHPEGHSINLPLKTSDQDLGLSKQERERYDQLIWTRARDLRHYGRTLLENWSEWIVKDRW